MSLNNKLARMQIENDRYFPKNYNENKPVKGYKKVISNEQFDLFQISEFGQQIVAAFKNVIVRKSKLSNDIDIYPNYCNNFLKYKIKFNSKNYPGLIPNSKIINVLIVPYLREVKEDTYYKRWRVIVITDKAQIFHNFPNRDAIVDGYEKYGDIKRFEESVIWDIPGRKFPSKNSKCEEFEEYKPYLPDDCYEYHPKINVKSKYGNVGFDKSTYVEHKKNSIKVSRFYFPQRNKETNPFIFMGGYEPDYKMTLLGTYQSNKKAGVRTCIFATSDGGRSWYAKLEFGDEGIYEFQQGEKNWGFNFGNKIKSDMFNSEFNGIANLKKRSINHNDEDCFLWSKEIRISKMKAEDTIVINTYENHNLSTGNIVALTGSCKEENPWCLLFNNDCNEKSTGNNVLFKVEKINDRTLKLYECVSNPKLRVACRHIHHINRIRDGWIIGTGEIYPNGWLFYMQMREADTYSKISASKELKLIRLNSTINSVQRTIGADIIEKEDKNILLFASDHDMLNKYFKDSPNEALQRGSTGVYMGSLNNIDNFNSFRMVYEAKEPAYFFKKLNNSYVFCGQRGELAISKKDNVEIWTTHNIGEPLIHFMGSTYMFNVIDKYLLIIK